MVLAIGVTHLYSPVMNGSPASAETFFSKLETPYTFDQVTVGDRKLNYCRTGQTDTDKPLIIFVHGAPGSWNAYKTYLADIDLREQAQLISVDRPGYGDSDYGHAITDIKGHAESIKAVIDKHPSYQVILIGHSYGGPIIGMVATMYPELINGMLMVAPVIDPESEPVKWYADICHLGLMRFVLPDYINVATTEKMSHKSALRDIKDNWQRLAVPVIHYHGVTDILAPYEGNTQFSKQHIDPQFLTLITEQNDGHFILWNKQGTIKKMILSLMGK